MAKTLGELLRERDLWRDRVTGYGMTNHYAYLEWTEAERIEFDVGYAQARNALARAEQDYQAAIMSAATNDPEAP